MFPYPLLRRRRWIWKGWTTLFLCKQKWSFASSRREILLYTVLSSKYHFLICVHLHCIDTRTIFLSIIFTSLLIYLRVYLVQSDLCFAIVLDYLVVPSHWHTKLALSWSQHSILTRSISFHTSCLYSVSISSWMKQRKQLNLLKVTLINNFSEPKRVIKFCCRLLDRKYLQSLRQAIHTQAQNFSAMNPH